MKKSLLLNSIIFSFNALIMFFTIALLLPFMAQSIQNISPMLYVNIYVAHIELYTIICSIVLAILLTFVTFRENFTITKHKIFIIIQLLILSSLVLVYYFNMGYLGELMYRPTYE